MLDLLLPPQSMPGFLGIIRYRFFIIFQFPIVFLPLSNRRGEIEG
jgi:hypothetical protein